MNWRRSLLWLCALLGTVVLFGLYLRELTTATEESGRELATTKEQLDRATRALQDGQAEAERLRKERDRLEREVRTLEGRLERQVILDEIPRVLGRVRGLKLRDPLRVRWVDRAFTKRFLRQSIQRQLPEDGLDGYTATLVKLGLLPPGYSLVASMEALLSEQAAGFYDVRTATLYVRDEAPARDLVLSHEIGHALQDQAFALRRLLPDRLDHDDRAFAARALVEGDASAIMQAYLAETLSFWKAIRLFADLLELLGLDQEKLQSAPLYVRESLARAYLDGLVFVQALRGKGGWARVDEAYRSPPESSEQILHPEKYLAGERPVDVRLPSLAAVTPGYRVLHENTLGELGVSALLRGAASSRPRAAEAARGWGGDRIRGYRRSDGRVMVVWRTAWDTPADAVEFRDALALLLEERHGRASEPGRAWQPPSGAVLLVHRGSAVLLVDGAPDPASARAIAAAAGVPPP